MLHLAPYALLALAAIYLLETFIKAKRSPLNQVPGPAWAKYTRIPLTFQVVKGRRVQYVHQLHEKYGSVVRVAPDEVDIADVDAAREIHSTNPKIGLNKTSFYRIFTDSENKEPPLFAMGPSKDHGQRRRVLARPMAESSLQSPDVEYQVHEKIDKAVSKMVEQIKTKGHVDVWNYWTFMASDVISQLAFGQSLNNLDNPDNPFSKNFLHHGRNAALRTESKVGLDLLRKVPIASIRRIFNTRGAFFGHAQQAMAQYRAKRAQDPSSVQTTLFSPLLTKEEKDGGINDAVARMEATGYLVAGTDTTANTMTFLTWMMARHPDMQRKLAAEVRRLPQDYTNNQLKELPYLNQVIKETLRLYSAAPSALPRECPPEGRTFAGYFIPSLTTLTTQAYSLHRDPTIFANPYEFDPSRWEEPTQAMKNAYMPFGGASRSCLGIHLAQMELRSASCRLFQTFDNVRPEASMTDEDMEIMAYFVIHPKGARCWITGDLVPGA